MMKVKKISRHSLTRSLFIGVVSVASVIGMASVGFASWSFTSQTEFITIVAEADNIYVDAVTQELSTFGVSVSGFTASVEHYKYYAWEDVYVLDENNDVTYTTDDSEEEVPVTELSYVEHDCYGDLTIHSDLSVSLTDNTSSGTRYETINTINYDDPTYTYLRIDIQLQGTLIKVSPEDATLALSLFPQYVISPECVDTSYIEVIYSYFIPVKSSSKLSLYSMALIDNITSGTTIPFNLDFTYDLSETLDANNTNYINQIVMTFSIVSESEYQEEINGGGVNNDEDEQDEDE